jgi:hypothetical protein
LEIAYSIAKVFEKKRLYEKALKWYNQIFNVRKKTLGNDNPATLDTAKSIAEVFDKVGLNDKASKWRNGVKAVESKDKHHCI